MCANDAAVTDVLCQVTVQKKKRRRQCISTNTFTSNSKVLYVYQIERLHAFKLDAFGVYIFKCTSNKVRGDFCNNGKSNSKIPA